MSRTFCALGSILVIAELLACVPGSEPLAPAGAAGFVTEPTGASRGEPFVTDDGWTLRFEELVLQGFVSASPLDPSKDSYSIGAETYLWNGRDRVELFAPGIAIGPARAELELVGRYLPYQADGEDIVDLGVDPRFAQRFSFPSDNMRSGAAPPGMAAEAPAILFVLRAQKEGRDIGMELALSGNRGRAGDGATVEVHADSLATLGAFVEAENLFRALAVTDPTSGPTAFGPFADADDGDGHLTAHELRTASCASCPIESTPLPKTLLDVLGSRVASVVRTGDSQR